MKSVDMYFDRLNEPIVFKYNNKHYLAILQHNKEVVLIAEFIEPIELKNILGDKNESK